MAGSGARASLDDPVLDRLGGRPAAFIVAGTTALVVPLLLTFLAGREMERARQVRLAAAFRGGAALALVALFALAWLACLVLAVNELAWVFVGTQND